MKRPIPIRIPARLPALCLAPCLALAAAALPGIAQAEVLSSSAQGFIVRIETPIDAAPAHVYSRLFRIGYWWSDAHTYSGKAQNMTLKQEPGGCFCESLAGGGFVRHAVLEYADPGKVARLSGALGPLQAMGATGMLSFDFSAAGAGTKLVTTYTVSGYQPDPGFAPIATPVDAVLKEQLTRLKRYVETGKPAP